MQTFSANIETLALENIFFRKVLYTGAHAQLVLMCLKPGEDIGQETHQTVDQFFRVEAGVGQAVVNGETIALSPGVALIVPAGAQHNVSNTGETVFQLYTLYSPPNHPEGTIHETKQDALDAEEHEHQ